jgi:Xaa-Pro aminopeptidase
MIHVARNISLAACFLLLLPAPPDDHGRRREALAGRLEKGLLAVLDPPIRRDTVADMDRNTQKFDFYYLTGLEQEGTVLLVRIDTGETALFLPEGRRGSKKMAKGLGVDRVLSRKALPGTARQWLKETGSPLWLKRRGSRGGREWQAFWKDVAGDAEVRDPEPHLVHLRLRKTPEEIETMRKVVRLGAEGLKKIIPGIRAGMRESDVAAAIQKVYGKGGAQRLSFPCIIGSGKNSTIIHYTKNRDTLKHGDVLLMDVGAELDHYASDITRTVPISPKFDPRQREIYQAVLDAQRAAEEKLKPGVSIQDLHEAANEVIRSRSFPRIPHLVGHYVGLSVHDCGDPSIPLEPGMVITIEPGIYLRDEGIGVRIEDMYLVTEDGHERLSEAVPREIDEIEALRSIR